MATAQEITVSLDPPLLERLQKLSQLTGKSVAELVELHVKLIAGWRPVAPILSSEVQQLQGALKMPADTDYDQTRQEYLAGKYGLKT